MKFLSDSLQFTADKCIDCDKCTATCNFLADSGSPGHIARMASANPENLRKAAVNSYNCSMCKLCSAVCPVDARPDEIFEKLRCAAQQEALFGLEKYSTLLNYEKTGRSFPFQDMILPKNAQTAFFPGCTLPALFPEAVKHTFSILRKNDPAAGMILSCCSKPSKMLGLEKEHNNALAPLVKRLEYLGISRVLTACPNCHTTLKEFKPSFEVISIYEELVRIDAELIRPSLPQATVHDPCVTRFETETHRAVRKLLEQSGVKITEMPHNGEKTICCGEGGAVGFHTREYSARWSDRRLAEAESTGLPMVTYCAGCVNQLAPRHSTTHLLDFLTVEREKMPNLPGLLPRYSNRLLLRIGARLG